MLQDGRNAIVVDPGEAGPVFDALGSGQLQLAAILVTHHHADHTGGVAALHAATAGAPVFGPARESIPEPFTPLAHGDFAEALGMRFEVIDIPGHTAGHIAFFLKADGRSAVVGETTPLLFCGDTLFPAAAAGCSKARRRRCWRRSTHWPRCPMTPAFAAATNTRSPTSDLRG